MQDAHRVLVTRSRYVQPAMKKYPVFRYTRKWGDLLAVSHAWNTGRISEGKDSPGSPEGNLAGGVATFIGSVVCEAADRP